VKNLIKFVWGNNSYGDEKPLFNINTTNAIEGENNALSNVELRHQPILQSIINFVSRCSKVQNKLLKNYLDLHNQNSTVCKIAIDIIAEQCDVASGRDVFKCDPLNEIYNVINVDHTAVVSLDQKICEKCKVRQQLCLPCCHIIAELLHVKKFNTLDYVHPCYKIDVLYQILCSTYLVIPNYTNMLPSTTQTILHPPMYNSYGHQKQSINERSVGRVHLLEDLHQQVNLEKKVKHNKLQNKKNIISNPLISNNNVKSFDLLVPATTAIHTQKSEEMD
jgi:hypothetical protein